MNLAGLLLCSRYSYPPNSLSLCGPDKQNDLAFYAKIGKIDLGTKELLSQFSTLYPYLHLIASENHITDPFDEKVVGAYWIGNNLLYSVGISQFANHLSNTLSLKRKIPKKQLELTLSKLPLGALPHHSFHVTNIYFRTGHLPIPYTIVTMDACLINWGKIKEVGADFLKIETQALTIKNNRLQFQSSIIRRINHFGRYDLEGKNLRPGDNISYHWGWLCQKLSKFQLKNLIYYTNLSLKLANTKISA